MNRDFPRNRLGLLVAVLLALFLVSLPGFGIETRSFMAYAAWAGPIFLILTLVVFVGGVIALVFLRSNLRRACDGARASGAAAILATLLDYSGIGGPAPPRGPLVLGLIVLLVGLAVVVVSYRTR